MAKKLRTILSELATDIKAINVDDHVSFRYLHSKFNDKLAYFLRIESKSRELVKDLTLWKTINCVKLIDVSNVICGYVDDCNTLKRSEIQLPEAYNTSYGQLIKVVTLDGKTNFVEVTQNTYFDYVNREYGLLNTPYWIENRYLYIPNTTFEAVKVLVVPKNSNDVDVINGEIAKCTPVLDSMVSYPDYLITLAKQEVLKELLGGYKRVIEDEKGDSNTNIKN